MLGPMHGGIGGAWRQARALSALWLALAIGCGSSGESSPPAPSEPTPTAPAAPPPAIHELVWQHVHAVASTAIDDEGRWLAVVGTDGAVSAVDLEQGAVLATRRLAEPGTRHPVSVCSRGPWVVVQPNERMSRIVLWNPVTDVVRSVDGHPPFALPTTCDAIASIGGDSLRGFGIVLEPLGGERRTIPLPGLGRPSADFSRTHLRYTPDGQRIALVVQQPRAPGAPVFDGAPDEVRFELFEVASGRSIRREVRTVDASHDVLVRGSADGSIHLRTADEVVRFDGTTGERREGRPLATWSELDPTHGRSIEVRDDALEVRSRTGAPLVLPVVGASPGATPFSVHPTAASVVVRRGPHHEVWSADGVRSVACDAEPDEVRWPTDGLVPRECNGAEAPPLWRAARGRLWARGRALEGSDGGTEERGRASPDGMQLAAVTPGGVRVWTLATGALERTIAGARRVLGWSPSGRRLVIVDANGRVTLTDLQGRDADVPIEGVDAASVELEGFSSDETTAVLRQPLGDDRLRLQAVDARTGSLRGAVAASLWSDRWLVGARAIVVRRTQHTAYALDDGRELGALANPERARVSADGTTLLACGAGRLEVYDAASLTRRSELPFECAGLGAFEVSGDGRLVAVSTRQGLRLVRTSDGASIVLDAWQDEARLHAVAWTDEGVLWALRHDDLARLAGRPREPSSMVPASSLAPYALAPTLLADFFAGRALPTRSATPRAVAPSSGDVRPVESPSPTELERDAFTDAPSVRLLAPLTDSATVRFAPSGPEWTATLWECEPIDPEYFSPGCGVLVLRAGERARHLLIDASYAVAAEPLLVVPRPDGGQALVLVEARGLELHIDPWHVHLVEDDGSGGPRLALRALGILCEHEAGCRAPRARVRYADLDRDGDLDLELTHQVAGRAQRVTFPREPDGFVLPEALRDVELAPSFGLAEAP